MLYSNINMINLIDIKKLGLWIEGGSPLFPYMTGLQWEAELVPLNSSKWYIWFHIVRMGMFVLDHLKIDDYTFHWHSLNAVWWPLGTASKVQCHPEKEICCVYPWNPLPSLKGNLANGWKLYLSECLKHVMCKKPICIKSLIISQISKEWYLNFILSYKKWCTWQNKWLTKK